MSVSPELMNALLAMDVYNRGPDVNLRGLSIDGVAIGNAILAPIDPSGRALAAGFFASAYDLNGQTIISFRGGAPDLANAALKFSLPLPHENARANTSFRRLETAAKAATSSA